jgi:hypothetical protein
MFWPARAFFRDIVTGKIADTPTYSAAYAPRIRDFPGRARRRIGQAAAHSKENQLSLNLEPCSKHQPNKLTANRCSTYDAVIGVTVKKLCHG